MGVLATAVTGSGGAAYTIDKSLRFRRSASAYLSRTFTSAGNRKTWTFSVWLKKSSNGQGYTIFGSDYGDPYTNGYMHFSYQSSPADALNSDIGPEGTRVQSNSSNIYRDPSSWYHVVIAFDTTQSTASNRIKFFVNGVQTTQTGNFPAQNFEGLVNTAGGHAIGYRMRDNDRYFDGYMAEINFVDSQALTPSSFGETNATTGVWQPKAYTGTYGTTGFYLKFTDVATTSGSNAGLGKDFSGNGNYWNTNNISVTAGTTYDSMNDSPTLTSSTVANYCTINPLAATVQTLGAQVLDISQANLYVGLRNTIILSTMGGRATGKYYWEITPNDNEMAIGVATPQINLNGSYPRYVGYDAYSWCYSISNGNCYHNGSVVTSTGVTSTTGDVVGFALDLDNQKLFVSKNGTWLNSGNPVSGSGAIFTNISNTDNVLPAISDGGGSVGKYSYHNYGQRPFSYTPPSGYLPINAFNLATPIIGATATTQANKYFDINLWTGNASARSITNSGFKPAFVWAKSRSNVPDNVLDDSVRGAGLTLISNSTSAEVNEGTSGLTSFDTSGFSIGGSSGGWNTNNYTYVGWQWRGSDSTAVSNTDGSITSTVSANTSAGFSVVTYTGNGSAGATVGHGLGVALKMLIVKNRVQGTYGNWNVWQSALTGSQYLTLNDTSAASTNNNRWNGTIPTSSVFSLGADSFGNTNKSGDTYVAYCFSEVAGYSKFGSYTGNGSTDGPFAYLGFRPRFVMVKKSSDTQGWYMYDSARGTYNVIGPFLEAQSSSAEGTYPLIDFLSNGFKIRESGNGNNTSGGTYIYMAFAENPFKYSLAR
jgi:hypothetical protein